MYTNDGDVQRLGRLAFPDYTGRKFQVHVCESVNIRSCWEGGSRDFFKFVRLHDMFCSAEMPQQSAYDAPIRGGDDVKLVPGLVCVEHSIFCGKDTGITIHVHAENAPKYLPAPVDLTEDEKTVLSYTKSCKSSYAGISNFRFHEATRRTKITLDRWEAAKASCIVKGLLNKAGALTIDGRNVNVKG